jgi:hypothetical protein
MLNLFRKLLFYIPFHSSKQKWTQYALKLLHDRDVERLVLGDRLIERVGEPFFEILLAAKDLWHQEVHK